jgi:hypothetical protein
VGVLVICVLVQGDHKASVHLMITIQVMFKVSPASLQTFTDTLNCVLEDHVQYSTVHIPNVFCDGDLKIISFLCVFCTVIISCTETF